MARIIPKKTPATRARAEAEAEAPLWTFLTNHAHVLLCIARDPQARVRDIADQVGITERAVMRIIGDLEETGYLTKERDGRRNVYKVRGSMPLRHPIERHRKVSTLLELVMEGS